MLVKNRGPTVMEGKRKAPSVKMNRAGQSQLSLPVREWAAAGVAESQDEVADR
jgi:hypothetical protein